MCRQRSYTGSFAESTCAGRGGQAVAGIRRTSYALASSFPVEYRSTVRLKVLVMHTGSTAQDEIDVHSRNACARVEDEDCAEFVWDSFSLSVQNPRSILELTITINNHKMETIEHSIKELTYYGQSCY